MLKCPNCGYLIFSENEKTIIKYLSQIGIASSSKYQIEKATKMKHSTVHQLLKKLEKKGIIEVKNGEVFRTGLRIKMVRLKEGFSCR